MEDKKWSLKWANMADSEMNRAAFDHAKATFSMIEDFDAKIVDYNEYMDLVREGSIAEPRDYWQVGPKHIGMIALKVSDKFTETWSKVNNAKQDFQSGWLAAMRSVRDANTNPKG